MNENKKDFTNIMSRCIEDTLFKIVDYLLTLFMKVEG